MRSRVAINSAVGTLGQVVGIAVSLVTTPLILHRLGATDYGAFAVLGSLTSYFGLLDLGIAGSMTRFIAVHRERGDFERAGALMAFGSLFYVALGAALFPILVSTAPAIGRFLELPGDVQKNLPMLLVVVLGLFIGWAFSGILAARLIAAHRLDASAMANVVGSLAYAVLVALVLPLSPTITTVFACMGGQLLLTVAVMIAFNSRLPGPLLSSPLRLDRSQMRELFSFSLWSQLSSITAVVNMEADKVIISRGIGVASVTPYHVANRLAILTKTLPAQLLSSLLPALTARITHGADGRELADLYARASRGLMVPMLVVAGFVAGAADALLQLWLNQRLSGAATLCAALIASYSINMLTGAGTTILRAKGQPRLETFYGTISAVLNIGFTALLIAPLGLYGVVAGTIIGNVLGSAVFVVLFHRREKIGWWGTVGHWLARASAVTILSGVAVHLFLDVAMTGSNRLGLIPLLAGAGVGYLAVFLVLGQLTALWTDDDRQMLSRLVARLPRRRGTA